MGDPCTHLDLYNPASTPSADGCEDCLRTGGRWVHLRMCRSCGHVGCCDSSPSKPASKHEALRDIKLRGGQVAVLLADYRMPEMSGIEFLEAAMDLFPHARRALLTAYADTDAAIAAINVVDVDHYLLKPWEPPEEKLYPVLDALIEMWRALGDRPVEETKLVGHRWSSESYRARDFLARNSVPYRWYSVDDSEGRRLLDAADGTVEDVPVLSPPDRS